MKLKVVVHQAEEGGYWAKVPSIPGCATQGESFEELLTNLYEAVEGCLSVEVCDLNHYIRQSADERRRTQNSGNKTIRSSNRSSHSGLL